MSVKVSPAKTDWGSLSKAESLMTIPYLAQATILSTWEAMQRSSSLRSGTEVNYSSVELNVGVSQEI